MAGWESWTHLVELRYGTELNGGPGLVSRLLGNHSAGKYKKKYNFSLIFKGYFKGRSLFKRTGRHDCGGRI